MTRITGRPLWIRMATLALSLSLLALTAPSIGQVEPQLQQASPEIAPLPILPNAFNVLSSPHYFALLNVGQSSSSGQEPPLAGLPLPLLPGNLNVHILSSPYYFALLEKYRASLGFPTRTPSSGSPLTATPETTGQSTVKAVNDSNDDVEPAIITTLPGTDRTTAVYIKYVPNGCEPRTMPTLYYSSTTDFVTFTKGNIPYAVAYCYQGDPWLDVDLTAGGIAPNRLYLTGIAFNPAINCPAYPCYFQPNAIPLWRSDTAGTDWSTPVIIDSEANFSNYFLDKPAVAVDNSLGTSRGYVYVVYYRFDGITGISNQIRFSRSTDGGLTFTAPAVLATGNAYSPQVVVGPTGYVYVLWQESLSGTDAIRLARSTTNGLSWDPIDTSGPQGIFVGTGNDPDPPDDIRRGLIKGPGRGVRAYTTTVARFNAIANTVSVVWHERRPNTRLTDVYYAAKTGIGWNPVKKQLNTDGLAVDHMNPALDYDRQGNFMVTWFDRRNDASNLNFQLFAKYMDAGGNFLTGDTLVGSFTSLPGTGTFDPRFIGDYQQTWFWPFTGGAKWIAAWSGVPISTNVGDIYETAITQP